MEKHYEKILFLVAVLVAGASAYFYLGSEGKLAEAKSQMQASLQGNPSGEPWQNIPVPEVNAEVTSTWEAVKPQDEDGLWLYQLFTSPKIWVDSDGKFIVEPPFQKEVIKKLFGFKYGELKNEAYPIKWKGYFVSGDGSKIVQLFDEAQNQPMLGKLNEEIKVRKAGSVTGKTVGSGITVKNFEEVRQKEDSGLIRKVTKVVLFDKNIGKEIVIFSNKPTFLEESRTISLLPDNGSDSVWLVRKVGDKFEANGAVYTVKELDFENEVVVVEKVPNEKGAPVQLMKMSKNGGNELLKQ